MRQVVLWRHPFCSRAVCRNSRLEPFASAWLFSFPGASVSVRGEMARALHPQIKKIDAPACSSGRMSSGGDLAQHIEPGQKQLQRGYSQMILTDAEHQWVWSGHSCAKCSFSFARAAFVLQAGRLSYTSTTPDEQLTFEAQTQCVLQMLVIWTKSCDSDLHICFSERRTGSCRPVCVGCWLRSKILTALMCLSVSQSSSRSSSLSTSFRPSSAILIFFCFDLVPCLHQLHFALCFLHEADYTAKVVRRGASLWRFNFSQCLAANLGFRWLQMVGSWWRAA